MVTYVEFVAEEACQVEARLSYTKLMGFRGRSDLLFNCRGVDPDKIKILDLRCITGAMCTKDDL